MQIEFKKFTQKTCIQKALRRSTTMQETIIETAGKIWEYLNENGEVTTKKNEQRSWFK